MNLRGAAARGVVALGSLVLSPHGRPPHGRRLAADEHAVRAVEAPLAVRLRPAGRPEEEQGLVLRQRVRRRGHLVHPAAARCRDTHVGKPPFTSRVWPVLIRPHSIDHETWGTACSRQRMSCDGDWRRARSPLRAPESRPRPGARGPGAVRAAFASKYTLRIFGEAGRTNYWVFSEIRDPQSAREPVDDAAKSPGGAAVHSSSRAMRASSSSGGRRSGRALPSTVRWPGWDGVRAARLGRCQPRTRHARSKPDWDLDQPEPLP